MSHRHWKPHVLVVAATTAAIASNARAHVFTVPGDFDYIQDAIDHCLDGDEIIVLEGTYTELINFNGLGITLRSTDPDDPAVVAATIIDGQSVGTVVTCNTNEGLDTVLWGFTIQGGWADTYSGGMLIDACSPTVTNCVFDNNHADDGGGAISMGYGAAPLITGCTFSNNTAAFGAGMYIYNSSPTLLDCTFEANTASLSGGGVDTAYPGTSHFTNCTFDGNQVVAAGGVGGGMSVHDGSTVIISGCTFGGNNVVGDGGRGGGMYNAYNANGLAADVTNCLFDGNQVALGSGGGMYNDEWSDVSVQDCTFEGNSASVDGGGIVYRSLSRTVTNCTFSGNSAGAAGGGLYNVGGNLAVDNCTFSGNEALALGGGMYNDGSILTVTGSTFCGNVPNHWNSPAAVDGDTRMSDFCPIPVCPSDTNGDGEVSVIDFLALLANWGACP